MPGQERNKEGNRRGVRRARTLRRYGGWATKDPSPGSGGPATESPAEGPGEEGLPALPEVGRARRPG